MTIIGKSIRHAGKWVKKFSIHLPSTTSPFGKTTTTLLVLFDINIRGRSGAGVRFFASVLTLLTWNAILTSPASSPGRFCSDTTRILLNESGQACALATSWLQFLEGLSFLKCFVCSCITWSFFATHTIGNDLWWMVHRWISTAHLVKIWQTFNHVISTAHLVKIRQTFNHVISTPHLVKIRQPFNHVSWSTLLDYSCKCKFLLSNFLSLVYIFQTLNLYTCHDSRNSLTHLNGSCGSKLSANFFFWTCYRIVSPVLGLFFLSVFFFKKKLLASPFNLYHTG